MSHSFGATPQWRHICADVETRRVAQAHHEGKSEKAARLFHLYAHYHDTEWGRPSHDEPHLFELLLLEGMQAGLSWLTILARREALRQAFADFNPQRLARFGEENIVRLLGDPRIIRNRRKIEAAILNARAWLTLHERGNSLERLLWQAVGDRPRINRWQSHAEVPATTPQAEGLSKTLSRLGFVFVGPVIVYSLMQAAGLVHDHLTSCPWHYDHGAPASNGSDRNK